MKGAYKVGNKKEITLDVTRYSGVDLERLGNTIIEHILRHIGMKRYERSGIKVFDITDSDLGKMTDASLTIYKGVNTSDGIDIYRQRLLELLKVLSDLEGSGEGGSIVTSLRSVIIDEVKMMEREEINLEELWVL